METKATRRPALIVFVDAFAFDYLAERPFLPGFWQAELALESLIGYSSGIVPALWSGLYPDQTNAWNEFFYQPRSPSRLLGLLDLPPHAHLRNALRLVLWRFGGRLVATRDYLPGIPPSIAHLFGRNRIQYRKFPPVPVGDAGLDARLRRAGIPYRFWYPSGAMRADRALADLEPALTDTDVFIYCTASIDKAGHGYGPNPRLFDAELTEIERFITGAKEMLSPIGPPIIIVVSDHGMTAVSKRFDLMEWLKPWELGGEYVAFLDSTMARFWDVGTVPLSQVVERLTGAGVGRFLTSDDRTRYGINFADNRFGDEIFLIHPGYLISPSFMEAPPVPFVRDKLKAMHGYWPEESSTRAVFLYHGPVPLPVVPRRVTDIVAVLDHLLKLDAPVMPA